MPGAEQVAADPAMDAARNEPARAQAECPRDAQKVPVQALYGRWQVRIEGRPDAIVQLQPHPDYAGVRGFLSSGAARAQLAGDIDDDGMLALDESEDGRSISAVWVIELQPGSCNALHGTWQGAGDEAKHAVVMTRISPVR